MRSMIKHRSGNEKDNKIQIGINRIFAILVCIVLGYFLLGELLLPGDGMDWSNDSLSYTEYAVYPGTWERVLPDGSRQKLTIPGKCKAKRKETVVMETVLPKKIEQKQYLCFRSAKQDMRFYLDGTLCKEYSTKDSRLFGKMSAAAYVFVEVTPSDSGKCLRVECNTDSSYSGILYTVYYGNPLGIWIHFFRQYGLELIVAFLTLILSIIAIIGSVTFRICYHKKIALEYLGWGIFFAAVWLITNSTFRQLLFPNLSIVNDITFLMIMLLALPYLLYMDTIQKGRYRMVYQPMEGISIGICLVCSFLHMTNICDFTDTIRYVSGFCILSILLMLVTILLDIRKGKVREYAFVAIGMIGVCIAAFIQIVIYFWRVHLFNGVILAVGLIFLLVFSTISTIREIVYMDREKQKALQASESKGKFLANMSHEIRTPIHAVLGMDAMILRESRDARIKEYAMDIQNAGQTLLSLINDILDISKIESGKLELLPVEYDFSSLIHDVSNMIKMKAADKGLAFRIAVDKKIPSGLFGDDVRIRQVLVNLLNNAVKYTQRGSVALKVTAKIQGDMAWLTFYVADTGMGIKKQDMDKLFAAFERIEEGKNRHIEGTGLGMSITTQLLEMMGSHLKVESEYQKGSVFSFTLQQSIVKKEPIGDLEKRLSQQAAGYQYKVLFTAPDAKILIVDDNAVNRRVLVQLLKATKIQIDEASGGKECLEKVKKNAYDLIFMDHMMPEMDGIETLHIMKKWKEYPSKNTPVVALTANAVSGARETYLKEGFCDFLSKPVKTDKMEKMIKDLLPKEKLQQHSKEERQTGSASDTIAKWAELEGIDWDYARLHCSDDAILLDTVKHFYQMIEADAAELSALLWTVQNKKDAAAFQAYRIKVHSMKSSAAMIGAVALSGVAKMLEDGAREQRKEMLTDVTPFFLQNLKKMKETLAPLCETAPKKGSHDQDALDRETVKKQVEDVMQAIQKMDVDAADAAIGSLAQYNYPTAEMQRAFEKLKLAVMDLDEDKTIRWSKAFLQVVEKES